MRALPSLNCVWCCPYCWYFSWAFCPLPRHAIESQMLHFTAYVAARTVLVDSAAKGERAAAQFPAGSRNELFCWQSQAEMAGLSSLSQSGKTGGSANRPAGNHLAYTCRSVQGWIHGGSGGEVVRAVAGSLHRVQVGEAVRMQRFLVRVKALTRDEKGHASTVLHISLGLVMVCGGHLHSLRGSRR